MTASKVMHVVSRVMLLLHDQCSMAFVYVLFSRGVCDCDIDIPSVRDFVISSL